MMDLFSERLTNAQTDGQTLGPTDACTDGAIVATMLSSSHAGLRKVVLRRRPHCRVWYQLLSHSKTSGPLTLEILKFTRLQLKPQCWKGNKSKLQNVTSYSSSETSLGKSAFHMGLKKKIHLVIHSLSSFCFHPSLPSSDVLKTYFF